MVARNSAPEDVTDADHAGDDLGVAVAAEPIGDALVYLGDLPVEFDDAGCKPGD
jgi:hypothetical protein